MTKKASFFFIVCLVLACCICAGCVSDMDDELLQQINYHPDDIDDTKQQAVMEDHTVGKVSKNTIEGDWILERNFVGYDAYMFIKNNTYSRKLVINDSDTCDKLFGIDLNIGDYVILNGQLCLDKTNNNKYCLICDNYTFYDKNDAVISSVESGYIINYIGDNNDGIITYNNQTDKIDYRYDNATIMYKRMD